MILLLGVLLLVGTGIIMVYSASSVLAAKRFGDNYYFLKRQVLFALFGIVVSALSGLLVFYLMLRRLLIGPEVQGVFTLFGILYFLLGVAIFGLGIAGEGSAAATESR